MKKIRSTLSFYGFNLFITLLLFIITLIPFFNQINQLFTDQLHGKIPARQEIVIVAIDDKSLQEIGAWPWDRTNFAKVIKNISDAGARVTGIDVLFLEKRSGDEEMAKALAESQTPVVLASKLDVTERTTLFPFFQLPKEQYGFINFSPDADAKIRRTFFPGQEATLQQKSFAFTILGHYFSPEIVEQKLLEAYPNGKQQANPIQFNYTSSSFTQVSFSDVLNGRVNNEIFKDRIVLIGTITQDLKSELADNLTDIFGGSTPGVVIHANIINSFLENRFQHQTPLLATLIGSLALCLALSFVFRKVESNTIEITIMLLMFIMFNVVGLFVFDFGINWPFLTFSLIIVFTYISSLAQKYISENKQRRFIQMAFSQYINPSLMKQLIDDPSHLKLGGEKRVMTVMFSDVRGFTTLSEKMDPEDLISLLNDYLDEMCEVILEQKGTIDKFIGDAIMALWNAPLDDTQHQLNGLKTAVLMVDTLNSFNKKHADTQLNIGVGLNTGDMVVGNVGSQRRFDYTVLGDNVNLASRIEGLTKKYGIQVLATESTIQGIQDQALIFRLIDHVIVKGKSKPIRLYQPLKNTSENASLKERYESAFALYEKGDFKGARKIWSTLSDDPTSTIMIERLKEIEDVKNWKGVWEWHEK